MTDDVGGRPVSDLDGIPDPVDLRAAAAADGGLAAAAIAARRLTREPPLAGPGKWHGSSFPHNLQQQTGGFDDQVTAALAPVARLSRQFVSELYTAAEAGDAAAVDVDAADLDRLPPTEDVYDAAAARQFVSKLYDAVEIGDAVVETGRADHDQLPPRAAVTEAAHDAVLEAVYDAADSSHLPSVDTVRDAVTAGAYGAAPDGPKAPVQEVVDETRTAIERLRSRIPAEYRQGPVPLDADQPGLDPADRGHHDRAMLEMADEIADTARERDPRLAIAHLVDQLAVVREREEQLRDAFPSTAEHDGTPPDEPEEVVRITEALTEAPMDELTDGSLQRTSDEWASVALAACELADYLERRRAFVDRQQRYSPAERVQTGPGSNRVAWESRPPVEKTPPRQGVPLWALADLEQPGDGRGRSRTGGDRSSRHR